MPDKYRVRGAKIAGLLHLLLMATVIVTLWPASMGGRALFVIVHGNSMEPTYHAGDTVYARTTDDFEVGQSAIYKIPTGQPGAGSMVIHRIRARTAEGRYIMQGDNSPTDDGALPAPTDLYARPVVDLGPTPRRLLIITPWAMALAVAVALAWYLWPVAGPITQDPAFARDPIERLNRTSAPSSTAPVIEWLPLYATTGTHCLVALPAFGSTIKQTTSIPKIGLDLTGQWASWRDAALGLLSQDGVHCLPAPDPFGRNQPLLTIDELLGFIAAADDALAISST